MQLLARDPRVTRLAPDLPINGDVFDYTAGWGVGRIDQRSGPSDNVFEYDTAGQSAVNIYILDSGVDGSHSDFSGRFHAGWSFNPTIYPAGSDCNGHGTGVAGVAAGTEYGVAKHAQVWSVRIDDCTFPASRADMIAGLDWVAINAVQPAVANLSYSMPAWVDGILPGSVHNAAVQLRNAGILLTVSAGNDTSPACDYSPGNAAELMTVGATNATDAKASFSNYGTCVDIFAPGENVLTATAGGSHALKSGTTYSAPMTAGVAALYMAKYPTDAASTVHYAIVHGATTGVVGFPTEVLLYSKLPAPVRVAIEGPVVVPPGALCNWTSVVRAGRAPFTFLWTGAVTSSSSGVSGSLSSSGSISLQVWDALGGTANDLINVTVDSSMSGMIICP